MINYLKNNKKNNILNNINKSNNNHSIKNESNYFNLNNDISKAYKKNRVNIFEGNSKLVYSKQLLNINKNREELSKQNSFDKDKKIGKFVSFNSNNVNIKNSRSHNKKKDLLNKIKIHSINENAKTITYEGLLKKKEEKSKTLINFNIKKINNKDTKYIRCKKEIFEKVSKKIGIGKRNELNLDLKKLKINKNNMLKTNNNIKSSIGTEINNNEKNDEKINIINKTDINKYNNQSEKPTIINKDEKKRDMIKGKNEIIEIIIKKYPLKINKNLEINNENKENKETKEKEKKEYENKKEITNNNNQIENIEKKECIKNEEKKNNEKIEESNNKEIENNNIEKETNTEEYNNNNDEEDLNCSYFDISKIREDSQIPKEYINIIYKNLLIEEGKELNPKPFYKGIKIQTEINEHMRSVLVDWIIDVHYKFGFTDETLFMTILIIDRYISTKCVSRLNFQLLGITALLISCKHEEINLPKIDDFIYITDNAYNKDEVFLMENTILHLFNFQLLYPSPIKFFELLTLKFNFDKKQFLMGKYLMESFLIYLKWVNYKPSLIACACAYIVMKFFKMENYQEVYNKKYYNIDENDYKFNENNIKECAKDICYYVDNINKTNFLSCKKKYANEENEKVSLIVEGHHS